MTLEMKSSDVSMIRSALYLAAERYFALEENSDTAQRRENYHAEGMKHYALAENLKSINSLEGK